MFGVSTGAKGLSFAKVLTGLSKTLSIANQVIPIYQQAKPMIQNAKSAFKVLKEFTKPEVKKEKQAAINTTTSSIPAIKKEDSISSISSNRPVFFL